VLASERLRLLAGIPLLPLDPQVGTVAAEIMGRAILPPKASVDALHIALAAHHGIQYLLTWNCKHIANAKILPRIRDVLIDLGCAIPIICTPEEMVDNESENT
jgi:predicted nucleic acid-binding protein